MNDSITTIEPGRVIVSTGNLETTFQADAKSAAVQVALLHSIIERLKEQLDEARRMACNACSSDVPLHHDGWHMEPDGTRSWCDAQLAPEPGEESTQ